MLFSRRRYSSDYTSRDELLSTSNNHTVFGNKAPRRLAYSHHVSEDGSLVRACRLHLQGSCGSSGMSLFTSRRGVISDKNLIFINMSVKIPNLANNTKWTWKKLKVKWKQTGVKNTTNGFEEYWMRRPKIQLVISNLQSKDYKRYAFSTVTVTSGVTTACTRF